MATISQIPFSLSFPSLEFRKPLLYYHRHHQPQLFVSYLNYTKKKHSFVCFACSIKQTRFEISRCFLFLLRSVETWRQQKYFGRQFQLLCWLIGLLELNLSVLSRVRKRVKSNEELRSEIMEFVASAGLPQGHVPSMKELSAHRRFQFPILQILLNFYQSSNFQ